MLLQFSAVIVVDSTLSVAYGEDKPSAGALLVLNKFRSLSKPATVADLADHMIQTIWFFVLPVGASAIFIRRCADFIPASEAGAVSNARNRSLATRLLLHLFSGRLWDGQPALPDRYLDKNSIISGKMPYIYSPLQSWCYLVIFGLSVFLAARGWSLYFRLVAVAPADVPSEPIVAPPG